MTAVAILPDSETSAALPATRMAASSISLADALRLLWRRKALLVAIVIIGTGIAAAIAFSLQPRYLASTEILLDPCMCWLDSATPVERARSMALVDGER